jgi:hypothetical protein
MKYLPYDEAREKFPEDFKNDWRFYKNAKKAREAYEWKMRHPIMFIEWRKKFAIPTTPEEELGEAIGALICLPFAIAAII